MNGTTALPANGMNKSQTSNSIHQQTNNTAKDHPYTITESPLGQPRPIRIVAVGAGASGLNLARQIDMHMENVDYVIYEKNSEVGGTWFENRYPGCTCDLPSVNYQFSWAPNTKWTKFYSPQSEILEYFKDLAKRHHLYRNIKLNNAIVGAEWDEVAGIWNVEIQDLVNGNRLQDWCHVLINASGILNSWKWPSITGIHDFEGKLMHSASWDTAYDMQGKTVAVIGSGSSGVQIVPALQHHVKSLITFIRSPTWITAGYAQNFAGPGGANFTYDEDQRNSFFEDPKAYLDYRKDIESELNRRFNILLKDTPEQAAAKEFSKTEMEIRIQKNPRLVKSLIPDFPVGCRRSTPGNGYLEALVAPNVRVVTDTIDRITQKGMILSTGEHIEFDALVCATGFDLSFRPRFPIIGRGGVSLEQQWTERTPQAYLSLAVENFPNYFVFLGPNAPIGHGSVLPIAEHAAKYMINMLKKMQTQGIKTFAPSSEAVRDFNEHIPAFMQRTVWSAHCRSWYKNGTTDGPIVGLHPGSRIHWFHMLDDPRFEDYEFTYWTKNRFQYLGNGFSTREAEGMDSAYYLDEPWAGIRSY